MALRGGPPKGLSGKRSIIHTVIASPADCTVEIKQI